MKILTREEWLAKGRELYGEDTEKWKFKCTHCENIQSAESIRKQFAEGIGSQRHGIPKKGSPMSVYAECYSPTCNWVAYGLFSSGIVVVIDPSKPYNIDRVENCGYIFPFADGE